MIQDMLMLQLRHAMETEAVNANERAAGAPLPGARMVAVAFADLVGFTRLARVPPEELERLANRLAEAAREVAVKPVRFIKTIGDAVMLVSPRRRRCWRRCSPLSRPSTPTRPCPSCGPGCPSGRR